MEERTTSDPKSSESNAYRPASHSQQIRGAYSRSGMPGYISDVI